MPAEAKYPKKSLLLKDGKYLPVNHFPSELLAKRHATELRRDKKKVVVMQGEVMIPVNSVTFTKTGAPQYKLGYMEQEEYIVYVRE